ncbi:MAG: hypothetical protein ACOCY8_00590, partial [Spirochaetota bacterium]
MRTIGRLNETGLHEQLKHLYAGTEGRTECEIDGYVVDVALPGEIVEIQTRGFGKLRRKIVDLSPRHRIRIVYPIAAETLISKLSDTGELLSSRRSPRRGRVEEVFGEIVWIADLLPDPRIQIDVVLARVVETRIADGKGSWRRKGVSIVARQLGTVVETVHLEQPVDYLRLLPDPLASTFTNADLMEAAGLRYRFVQPITRSLRKMGLVQAVGREGRQNVYEIVR